MKIFVLSDSVHWTVGRNEYSPYWENMYMVVFNRYPGLKEVPKQIVLLDYSEEMYHGLGQDGGGYESQKYRIVLNHK